MLSGQPHDGQRGAQHQAQRHGRDRQLQRAAQPGQDLPVEQVLRHDRPLERRVGGDAPGHCRQRPARPARLAAQVQGWRRGITCIGSSGCRVQQGGRGGLRRAGAHFSTFVGFSGACFTAPIFQAPFGDDLAVGAVVDQVLDRGLQRRRHVRALGQRHADIGGVGVAADDLGAAFGLRHEVADGGGAQPEQVGPPAHHRFRGAVAVIEGQRVDRLLAGGRAFRLVLLREHHLARAAGGGDRHAAQVVEGLHRNRAVGIGGEQFVAEQRADHVHHLLPHHADAHLADRRVEPLGLQAGDQRVEGGGAQLQLQPERLRGGAQDVDLPADDLALFVAEIVGRGAEGNGDREGLSGRAGRNHLGQRGIGLLGQRRDRHRAAARAAARATDSATPASTASDSRRTSVFMSGALR